MLPMTPGGSQARMLQPLASPPPMPLAGGPTAAAAGAVGAAPASALSEWGTSHPQRLSSGAQSEALVAQAGPLPACTAAPCTEAVQLAPLDLTVRAMTQGAAPSSSSSSSGGGGYGGRPPRAVGSMRAAGDFGGLTLAAPGAGEGGEGGARAALRATPKLFGAVGGGAASAADGGGSGGSPQLLLHSGADHAARPGTSGSQSEEAWTPFTDITLGHGVAAWTSSRPSTGASSTMGAMPVLLGAVGPNGVVAVPLDLAEGLPRPQFARSSSGGGGIAAAAEDNGSAPLPAGARRRWGGRARSMSDSEYSSLASSQVGPVSREGLEALGGGYQREGVRPGRGRGSPRDDGSSGASAGAALFRFQVDAPQQDEDSPDSQGGQQSLDLGAASEGRNARLVPHVSMGVVRLEASVHRSSRPLRALSQGPYAHVSPPHQPGSPATPQAINIDVGEFPAELLTASRLLRRSMSTGGSPPRAGRGSRQSTSAE